ncbi:MAG: hypothetical protein PWP07_575 [Epulopiscium sp.]|nr:hypothetical protein [Candidatus Epulonipiscium sp.]
MVNNRKKRMVALATTAVLLSSSAIYAAPTTKTLKATFNGIRISYNGQIKTDEKEPFIVDNTTYVPLRMVAELVGKTVKWDAQNKQIIITDNGISTLTAQLAQKSLEIVQLKQEKTALEEQIKTLQNSKSSSKNKDLSDLEDQIIEDYEEYKNIEFDIQLSGNSSKISLKIKVDLDDYKRAWNKLTQKDIQNYIEDICDDIWDTYDSAKIEGYIYDTDSRDYLVEFKSDSKKKLKFTFDNVSDTLEDLEKDLYSYYKDYLSGIRLSSIELSGDRDDIVYEVRIDYSEYKDKWKALSDSEITRLMSKIYNEIEDEFRDADIEGYIYTKSNKDLMFKYYRSSSGSDRYDRYNP